MTKTVRYRESRNLQDPSAEKGHDKNSYQERGSSSESSNP